MKIDNFALTMHQACPAKYDLRIRQGWTSRSKSGALGFGGAFHEGLATWYRTKNLEASLRAIQDAWDPNVPHDDYRTLTKCYEVFIEYTKTYPTENFQFVQGSDGPLIEVAFTLDTGLFVQAPCHACHGSGVFIMPVIVDQTSEGIEFAYDDESSIVMQRTPCVICNGTGTVEDPIEYGGIFDGLVEFGNKVYILEHKTTSQMGPMYFNQFKPNNQITGYIWAARLLSGRDVGGAIINAIKVTKTGKTEFKRQIVTRSDEEIEQWLKDLKVECQDIASHERIGAWPMRTPSCMQYGACEFYDVHSLSGKAQQKALLEQQYVIRRWDYEARDLNKGEEPTR